MTALHYIRFASTFCLLLNVAAQLSNVEGEETNFGPLVTRKLVLDAEQLAGGLEMRRMLLADTGLEIDNRNQTEPASVSWITTDVLDLAGDVILSCPIDVQAVRASVCSNAIESDRLRIEMRSGSTYFQLPGTWSEWSAPPLLEPLGQYIQLRVLVNSLRDELRITSVELEWEQSECPSYASSIAVEDHTQHMVRSTIPFEYQRPDHSDLRWLLDTFRLDAVTERHSTELAKVNALCTWVASRANDRHEGWNEQPYYPWNVRFLIDEKQGGTIYGHCASYCAVFIACCESLGWQGRHLAIEGYKTNSHETAEIFISELGRWIYFDPSLATYYVDRASGEPLDTLQMHNIYLATLFNRPGDTVPKIEMNFDELTRRRESIDWSKFPAVPVSANFIYGKKGVWHWKRAQGIMTTAWLQLTPRTNFYDQKEPVFRQFGWGPAGLNGYPVWVDSQTPPRTSETQNYYTRRRDFYWTLNQASVRLVRTAPNSVTVELGNNQPFFKQYRIDVNGAESYQDSERFEWNLEPGKNRLVVNCEDEFGRLGIASQVTLRLGGDDSQP